MRFSLFSLSSSPLFLLLPSLILLELPDVEWVIPFPMFSN
jgi:hypothetical protein